MVQPLTSTFPPGRTVRCNSLNPFERSGNNSGMLQHKDLTNFKLLTYIGDESQILNDK